MRELLDVVFPTRCVVCGASGDVICHPCVRRIPRLDGQLCARCGSPAGEQCRECMGRNLAFTTARSAVAYQGGVARAVGAWKEGGVWRITRVAATITADVIPRPDVDVLTSVPPDRDRVPWRGHDPAGALARELGHVWQLPYQRMLRRASVSAAQKDLDATQRERNAAGSFKASKPVPARLGVVDDVYTTGATVSAAARALRSRGAGTVYVVTFARALRTRRRDVASGPVVQPAPLESDQ